MIQIPKKTERKNPVAFLKVEEVVHDGTGDCTVTLKGASHSNLDGGNVSMEFKTNSPAAKDYFRNGRVFYVSFMPEPE